MNRADRQLACRHGRRVPSNMVTEREKRRGWRELEILVVGLDDALLTSCRLSACMAAPPDCVAMSNNGVLIRFITAAGLADNFEAAPEYMPTRALSPCTYPRCGQIIVKGRCARHKTKDDRRAMPAGRGYGARWRRARRDYLLRHPFRAHCRSEDCTTAASVVDHVEPYRGDMVKFWDVTNWQSLCAPCHDGWKARVESLSPQGGV
jgi:5-methylcytosine-specific restriction enzyme A